MNQYIVILVAWLLILQTSSNEVKKSDACTCEQLKNEADCNLMQTCQWTPSLTEKTKGTCAVGKTSTVVLSGYCTLLVSPTECREATGCAYINSKCTHFTGCTAYVMTTDAQCQAISKECTTDGDNCIPVRSCSEYTTQLLCDNTSNSGNRKCKWDLNSTKPCRDQICSDADSKNNNDELCNAFYKGCVSNGKECIQAPKLPCAYYFGDANTCPGYLGSDGNCRGDIGGSNCRARICTEAPTTINIDSLCALYQTGCITSGMGCVTAPLPPCNTYFGNDKSCVGYKGSDGICEGDVAGKQCRGRICNNAPKTLYTNESCASYKTGCVTTGYGCIATRGMCIGYIGTTITCNGYIGSDGYCKGISETIVGACQPKVCTEAATTLNTDVACQAYQTGCITSGKGCVATRGACSGYTGTSTTCVGYQGSDGYCKGTSSTTVGACSPMVCTEAAATLNTDAACAAYQIGCRTTGKGCIATLGACSSYNGTATSCDYVGTDGKCKGSGTTSAPCVPRICTDAPITLASNTQCANYQTGCVTNGTGCVAPTSCSNTIRQLSCQATNGCGWQNSCLAITLCSDFITQGTCLNNQAGLTAATKKPCYWTGSACRDLACTDASTTFNTDSQCNTHLAGCVTNARGCVALTAPCSNYQGTQTTCSNFTKRCWNDAAAVATTTCIDRTCAHDVTSTTDGACISFLSTCLTKGTGCIDKTALCSAYLGNQATCIGFKGNNQIDFCYNTATATATTPCIVKVCTDNTIATADGNCGTFMTGCLWNGATGCVSKTASCYSYTGTTTTCVNFKGANGTNICSNTFATATSCINRACSHAAITLKTDTACQDYLSSCVTNGAGCVSSAPCSTYTGDANQCSNFTGNSKKCFKKDGCSDRACGDLTTAVNQAACDAYLNDVCQLIGTTCFFKVNCRYYTALASQCQTLTGTDGACWSQVNQPTSVASACTLKTCGAATNPKSQTDCTNWKSGCRYSAPNTKVCVESTINCAGLKGIATECQAMTGNDGACWSSTGASTTIAAECVLKECALITAPTNYEACTNFLKGCRFSAPTTANVCVASTTTCSGLQGTISQCQIMSGNDGACWSVANASTQQAAACTLKVCSLASAPADIATCTTFTTSGCHFSRLTTGGNVCLDWKTTCAILIGLPWECQAWTGMDGPCWSQPSASARSVMPCILKTCNLIATTPSDQSSCDAYMKTGCIFNGASPASCLQTTLSNCAQLSGTTLQCNTWTAKDGPCWSGGIQKGTQIGVCRLKLCSDKAAPASLINCTAHMAGCLFTSAGPACVAKTTRCSGLKLIPSLCQSAIAADGPCWSGEGAGATAAACVTKNCSLVSFPSASSSCSGFESGCQFSKLATAGVCKSVATACSGLYGLPGDCNTFTGSDGRCGAGIGASSFLVQACVAADCSNIATAPTTEQDCTTWSSSCHLTKARPTGTCILAGACNTFFAHDPGDCKTFYGPNGVGTCGNGLTSPGPCADRTCENIYPPPWTELDCTSWLSTCHLTKTTGTGTCILAGACSTFTAQAAGDCLAFYGINGVGACTFGFATPGPCADKTCANIIPSPTTELNCTSWLSTCHLTKTGPTGTCIVAGACSTFTAQVAGDCLAFYGTNGVGTCVNGVVLPGPCADKTCANIIPSPTTELNCTSWLSTCHLTKTGPTGTCIVAGACSTFTAQVAGDCLAFYGTNGVGTCVNGVVLPGPCADKTCANITPAPTADANCINWLSGCKFTHPSAAATCIVNTSKCTEFQGTQAECQAMTGADGACWPADVHIGTMNCVLKSCGLKTSPTILTDCTGFLTACLLSKPTAGNICVPGSYTCAQLQGLVADCQGYTAADGPCWSVSTDTAAAACQLRTCAHKTAPTSNTDCTTHLLTCIITQPTSGSNCVPNTTYCNQLQGTPSYCQSFTGGDGACWSAIGAGASVAQNCVLKTCELLASPNSASDCNAFLPGCKFSRENTFCTHPETPCAGLMGTAADCQEWTAKNGACWSAAGAVAATIQACVLKSSLACNAFTGDGAYCNALTQSDGKCWWSGAKATTSAACKARTCTDDIVSTTDSLCAAHLTGCKTKGVGCVASSTPCASLTGTSATCPLFTSSTGTNKCKFGISVSGACQDKSCYDDVTSATNYQCEAYITGCLTKGAGCIPNTAPCSEYSGVQATCGAFVGSSGTKKCWNSASATPTAACSEKQCTDDVASTTDAACAAFLTGCITKGVGCVPATSACSTFSGTTATCGNFKGNSGTKLCWNISTATATTACVEKMCSHNTTSITDADCAAFLPSTPATANPLCVTNGTGCVDYPRACSAFTGTTEACGKFRAIDGPCKSSVLTGSGACTPRICTEALNNLNTDVLCKAWNSSCVTNGYGCVTSVACSSVTEMTSCNAKTGCGWLSSCQTIGASCSSLTALGQSICANTFVISGTKACGWFNSVCRDLTCDDLSANFTTDTACAAIISTCTTKGAGCITKGLCSTYSSKSICEAAKTTNVGDTCIWDATNVCRAKKCTDAPIGSVTNTACDAYLTTCKTNGMTCIDTTFNCNAIRTQVACLKDGMNNPCLWVNGICYNYAKCEDVTSTTHAVCQRYSPQCTTNGVICVSINKCEKTRLVVSCEIGTNGKCGWLPATGANAAKCQKFGACTDAIGTTLGACTAYDPTCISDGTKCITRTPCGNYQTQVACETNGSDGTCQWTPSGTTGSCRLRECSDATALNATAINSFSGCHSFIAKTKCYTDGTKCIPIAECKTYTIEAHCVLGTDGTCTYDLAVGATTGKKSCRLKVCTDFIFSNFYACSTALTGAGAGIGCVSNGTNCIAKAACSTYTAREACNGGGSDGICAFTAGAATTPNVGTCKLMTACTDANNDQFACSLKPAACKFTSTTTGTTTTTTCAAQTCATVAAGTSCNPVPSFDGTTYSICLLFYNYVCLAGSGASLSSTTCFSSSLGTYSWNIATGKCEACNGNTIPTNTQTNDGSGETGETGKTTFSSIVQTNLASLTLLTIFA